MNTYQKNGDYFKKILPFKFLSVMFVML